MYTESIVPSAHRTGRTRALLLAALGVLLTVALLLPSVALAAEPVVPTGLTDGEVEALLFMREEEKLAQDVYLFLGDVWGTRVFTNIARAEAQHQSAVLNLMEQYGIEDPAADLEAGAFTVPALQSLYDELIAQGSLSLADALEVGAIVEETDIADLDKELETAENAAVIRVLTNLRRGSENHLRAFTRLLESQTGEAYAPQILDADSYDEIAGDQDIQSARANPASRSNRPGRGGRP